VTGSLINRRHGIRCQNESGKYRVHATIEAESRTTDKLVKKYPEKSIICAFDYNICLLSLIKIAIPNCDARLPISVQQA
jgi:hypothetical protein